MAIHNKSHFNHGLMSLNKKSKENNYIDKNIKIPDKSMINLSVMDCCDFLKKIPNESVDLICIDPPYNLELAVWDIYDNYIEWAAKWIEEAYRVLAKNGNLIIFGGIQFRNAKSGDIIDLIHYIRNNTEFNLINTIIWRYKNGMSAHRYFANRHEEIIWLSKSDNYYFDLDSVREKYSEKDLETALKDKRLNPQNTIKGKNPTNVWEINRLNGNSSERVGHPTQKPVKIIERIIKSLSYPGSVVLDFFAGSGTIGRVCISEKRHCIMCDRDVSLNNYFKKHLDQIGIFVNDFIQIENLDDFFSKVNEEKYK